MRPGVYTHTHPYMVAKDTYYILPM
jgi:hypothetical protein